MGLFADNPEPLDTTRGRMGLFKGKGLFSLWNLKTICYKVYM